MENLRLTRQTFDGSNTYEGISPRYSPNGQWILYRGYGFPSGRTRDPLQGTHLYIMPVNFADDALHLATVYQARFTPDGEKIVYHGWTLGEDVMTNEPGYYSVHYDGTGLETLTQAQFGLVYGEWQPGYIAVDIEEYQISTVTSLTPLALTEEILGETNTLLHPVRREIALTYQPGTSYGLVERFFSMEEIEDLLDHDSHPIPGLEINGESYSNEGVIGTYELGDRVLAVVKGTIIAQSPAGPYIRVGQNILPYFPSRDTNEDVAVWDLTMSSPDILNPDSAESEQINWQDLGHLLGSDENIGQSILFSIVIEDATAETQMIQQTQWMYMAIRLNELMPSEVSFVEMYDLMFVNQTP